MLNNAINPNDGRTLWCHRPLIMSTESSQGRTINLHITIIHLSTRNAFFTINVVISGGICEKFLIITRGLVVQTPIICMKIWRKWKKIGILVHRRQRVNLSDSMSKFFLDTFENGRGESPGTRLWGSTFRKGGRCAAPIVLSAVNLSVCRSAGCAKLGTGLGRHYGEV